MRSLADWISRTRGLDEARVPEAAFDPLYSTWYAFLQDVRSEELEAEARLAAEIGMKTMILDDGWQKVESKGLYTATGDWMPARGRFPDMKAHVAAVHAAGLKYMLWLSVPEAIDRLLKDVRARLAKIRPDVLIEFRQSYEGPAIRQYGNMMRAADCPGDPTANRRRICDLRLTSGKMAVHSDMLVWSPEETPEGAALPILNALFATIQYSMVLAKLSPEHRRVISAWLRFSQEHREALLKGAFWPHHPELGYPWIEGESADERVVAVYADDVCAKAGLLDRTVFLVNATGKAGLLAELPSAPAKVEIFDVFGEKTGETAASGLVRLPVPASGYARLAVNR